MIHSQWSLPGASQVVSCNGAKSQQGHSELALAKTVVSSLTWFPQREAFFTPSLSVLGAAAFINPHHRKCLILWEGHLTRFSLLGRGFLIILLAGLPTSQRLKELASPTVLTGNTRSTVILFVWSCFRGQMAKAI